MSKNILALPKMKDMRKTIRKHPTKRYSTVPQSRKTHLIVHQSLTLSGSAESYANYHIDTHGWAGIAYHFVIEKDGTTKWCNDLGVVSYHAGNANIYSVGVSLTGDFRTQNPTDAQYESFYRLIAVLKKELNITDNKRIIGHQEAPTYIWKQCPGLDMDALRGHIASGKNGKVRNNFNNDTKILIDVPHSTETIVHEPGKVYWKDMELRKGQKGIITIIKPINLWKRVGDKLEEVRVLHPNEKYRVYNDDDKFGGQYAVGDGYYITKMPTHITYETPSKSKLAEVGV